jgi:hypothetical protein
LTLGARRLQEKNSLKEYCKNKLMILKKNNIK